MVRFYALSLVLSSVNAERSYTGNDPIGLELAGALKNVYAIAAGMSDGLGFENNTRASAYPPFDLPHLNLVR